MAGPVRHIRRHLRHSNAAAALLDELERRDRLLATIRGAIPAALAAHCRHAGLISQRLTLVVDSPVWVDRLRFLSPQFVDALIKTGVEVSECRVRAAPDHRSVAVPADSPPGSARAPSAVARSCLEQAAAAVADRALAESLGRLAITCDPIGANDQHAQPTANGCE